MPTYEYACSACGHQWEQSQRIIEDPIKVCPKCSKPEAHRLISAGTNFILKGGGWYSDLYSSSKSSKTETSTSAESSGKTESKSDTKAESKPATDTKAASSTPSTPSSGSSSTPSTSS